MAEDQLHSPDIGNERNRSRAPDPERFVVSKNTLRIDAFMTRFIFVGGLSVIVSIFGIFFFILAEIIPLFRGAEVEMIKSVDTGVANALILGTDEWTELPFIVSADGSLHFFSLVDDGSSRTESIPLPESVKISSGTYLQESQSILLGLSNGHYLDGSVDYQPEFSPDGSRTIIATITWDQPRKFSNADDQVLNLNMHLASERKTIAGILKSDGKDRLLIDSFIQKRSLFGASGFSLDHQADLTKDLTSSPIKVLVGANAKSVVVQTDDHHVHYFTLSGKEWKLEQVFRPFEWSNTSITSMDYIKGRVSLSLTAANGEHSIFSLYRFADTGIRRFGKTKDFDPFAGGASVYASSSRNKAFVIANDSEVSLRYATTSDIRWQSPIEEPFRHIAISGKFDRLLGLQENGSVKIFEIRDPHPEAGFRAFFAKIWYEGQDSPQFLWQSTGGSDDFEPKLSLIPLIVGSFKGTLYALIFAVPIALLSAIYTSQFLNPSLKKVIKPGIEIMASLPSVVLGFLAALWLAPLIENRIPSLILICIALPMSAVLIGFAWNQMPIQFRVLIPKGWEFIIFVPLIVIVSIVTWNLGPAFERMMFSITDPSTGETISDFRLWWEQTTGDQFQQRNSLIVGFMMGFAVIPIIYTIAEDALSAVPPTLTSGSLALGASRWQTTARLVLPTASAGIFSACMIGLGRAVGETMIVVMATGNTPIMDMDIFSGMRTLSANIAVELPEAPHGGTLYRTLFLGAFVLFVLTFFVNTVAETMRHRLREKYKVIN